MFKTAHAAMHCKVKLTNYRLEETSNDPAEWNECGWGEEGNKIEQKRKSVVAERKGGGKKEGKKEQEKRKEKERRKRLQRGGGVSRRWRKHSICESVKNTRERLRKRRIIASEAAELRS